MMKISPPPTVLLNELRKLQTAELIARKAGYLSPNNLALISNATGSFFKDIEPLILNEIDNPTDDEFYFYEQLIISFFYCSNGMKGRQKMDLLTTLTTDDNALKAWRCLLKCSTNDTEQKYALDIYETISAVIWEHCKDWPVPPCPKRATSLAKSTRLLALKLEKDGFNVPYLGLLTDDEIKTVGEIGSTAGVHSLTDYPSPEYEIARQVLPSLSIVDLLDRYASSLDNYTNSSFVGYKHTNELRTS